MQFVREFTKLGLTRSVGGVLALALARELTPVVTCIILAGRVGSTFAAELGTMSVRMSSSVLPFQPKYRLGHPKKYLFSLSKICFPDQSIQIIFCIILNKEALVFLWFLLLAEVSVTPPGKVFIFIFPKKNPDRRIRQKYFIQL